jgi:type I restriction enzyme S subunit
VTKGLNPNVKMKDSGIEWLGEIPEHWKVSRIKHETSKISKGTTPSTEGLELAEKGIRFLKAENITQNGITTIPEFFIDNRTHVQLSRSNLQAYDVLVVIAGATTGKAAVFSDNMIPANTNQAVSFIRLKDSDYAYLLAEWLQTKGIQDQIWQSAVQSAQPNLSMENLGNLLCLVPPKDEMTKLTLYCRKRREIISLQISSIDRSLEILHEYRTALISAAVTGKIDVRKDGQNE